MSATNPPTPSSRHGHAATPTNNTPQPGNSPLADGVASPSPSSSSPALEPIVLSEDYVQQAQPDELRAIIASLMPLLQEVRTDASHHKLQYRMLALETTEAMERIHVEMDMARRETEVFNTNNPLQPRILRPLQESDPSIRRVHVDIWDSMVKELDNLKFQNAQLDQLVSQHKRMVVQQESEIATLNDRITLYRERLRENRSHLTRYRRAVGFLDSPHKAQSALSSPYTTRERDQPPFAALLHASDLISSRSPSSPQTPRRNKTPMTRMPYETPQTLQSSCYLQVPHTAPPLRGPQFGSSNSQRLAPTRHQTTMLEQVLMADESGAETDVPDEDMAKESVSGMPSTPTKSRKKSSLKVSSDATQQKLSGQVRKGSMQRDQREALGKPSNSEQTRPRHMSTPKATDVDQE